MDYPPLVIICFGFLSQTLSTRGTGTSAAPSSSTAWRRSRRSSRWSRRRLRGPKWWTTQSLHFTTTRPQSPVQKKLFMYIHSRLITGRSRISHVYELRPSLAPTHPPNNNETKRPKWSTTLSSHFTTTPPQSPVQKKISG